MHIKALFTAGNFTMARNRTFSLNLRWRALLKDAGMEPEHLLRQAGLPDDTFSDINRGLTTDEYLRFWRVLEKEIDDQAFPLPFVERISAEVFDPPLFAALCSTHMMQAVQRLAKYKLLIAPMVLETTVVQNGTLTVSPRWLGATEIPASLEVAELAFLLRLNRLATREPVQAVKVTLSKPSPASRPTTFQPSSAQPYSMESGRPSALPPLMPCGPFDGERGYVAGL
ncbi:AraC family transcriptional regulator [Klebsiella variicola subsp. variicola]|nr:AraC family transcriptional regulator [Klebsiella variicola subsp. variicola]